MLQYERSDGKKAMKSKYNEPITINNFNCYVNLGPNNMSYYEK